MTDPSFMYPFAVAGVQACTCSLFSFFYEPILLEFQELVMYIGIGL